MIKVTVKQRYPVPVQVQPQNGIQVKAYQAGPPGPPAFNWLVFTDYIAPYQYIATAPVGSAEDESVWHITRIEIALDGTTTILSAINVKWTDRLTTPYT